MVASDLFSGLVSALAGAEMPVGIASAAGAVVTVPAGDGPAGGIVAGVSIVGAGALGTGEENDGILEKARATAQTAAATKNRVPVVVGAFGNGIPPLSPWSVPLEVSAATRPLAMAEIQRHFPRK